MRFPATEQGKKAKGVHIDWHFKVNTRVQDSSKNAVNRSWYIDERVGSAADQRDNIC
jgi:pre-mRNA cleavage complex 2 protein Pcf11